ITSNNEYLSFFSTKELFNVMNSGIQSKRDYLTVGYNKEYINQVYNDFTSLSATDLRNKYSIPKDGRDWKLDLAIKDLKFNQVSIIKEHYRPFDFRYSFYTGNSKGIVAYPRRKVSKHIIEKDNLSISLMRQFFQDTIFSHVLISNHMVDERTMYSNRGGTYVAPLYLYPEDKQESMYKERIPNLNKKIIKKITTETG